MTGDSGPIDLDSWTQGEIEMENPKLLHQQQLLEHQLLHVTAQLDAANAHCTVMQRAASDAKTQLENQKKKTCKSVKTKSRFITPPEMQEAFNLERAEWQQKEREAAERGAQKSAEDEARAARINRDTVFKVFDGTLTSYKWKEDLIFISGALGLQNTGTVAELMTRIKVHLDVHPELAQNAWFSGLFGAWRCQGHAAADLPTLQMGIPVHPPLYLTCSSYFTYCRTCSNKIICFEIVITCPDAVALPSGAWTCQCDLMWLSTDGHTVNWWADDSM